MPGSYSMSGEMSGSSLEGRRDGAAGLPCQRPQRPASPLGLGLQGLLTTVASVALDHGPPLSKGDEHCPPVRKSPLSRVRQNNDVAAPRAPIFSGRTAATPQ